MKPNPKIIHRFNDETLKIVFDDPHMDKVFSFKGPVASILNNILSADSPFTQEEFLAKLESNGTDSGQFQNLLDFCLENSIFID